MVIAKRATSQLFVCTCTERRQIFSDQQNLKEEIVEILQQSHPNKPQQLAVTSEAKLCHEMKYSAHLLQNILVMTKNKRERGQRPEDFKESEGIAAVRR